MADPVRHRSDQSSAVPGLPSLPASARLPEPKVMRFEDLQGDFWPADESAEEIIETIRRWRREDERA